MKPNIFPALRYRDGHAALAWLERAFGFVKTIEVPGAGGGAMHAEMRLGDGIIMLDSGRKDPAVWGDNDQAVYVYVANPDAHYARAAAAGARIVRPLHDTPWGSRGYYAFDLDGLVWGFSTSGRRRRRSSLPRRQRPSKVEGRSDRGRGRACAGTATRLRRGRR
jgi:uncharacterized glyoxalase superfamily protein PhnB